MLTLLPLPAGQGAEVEGAGRQVPWFGAVKGFCLVRCLGGRELKGALGLLLQCLLGCKRVRCVAMREAP